MTGFDQVRSRLREAGLRATRPRVLVYATLREIGGHRAVDEIVGVLRARGEPLPRTTVYNVVSDLRDRGLVMCADAGPGRALYEASDTPHHHFVCRACRAVIDVPCAEDARPHPELPAGIAGVVDDAQVIYRGLCEPCVREQRAIHSTFRID